MAQIMWDADIREFEAIKKQLVEVTKDYARTMEICFEQKQQLAESVPFGFMRAVCVLRCDDRCDDGCCKGECHVVREMTREAKKEDAE